MFSITGTTLTGVTKGTDGLWLEVLAPTSGMTIPTTASTFALGCKVTNIADGLVSYNTGTVAAPVWESGTLSKTISLTAAQINALYTTSIEVIPAVANRGIIMDSMEFDLTGTATQFAGGGVVNLQYKNTANGAGTTLHADIAASVVTGATGRVITQRIPKDISATAAADIIGVGVFIGAKTAVFTTGTGTAQVRVKYHLV